MSRRGFLKTAATAGAALASTLWFPRRGRGQSMATPAVKRVVILTTPGGQRWTCTFDGQPDATNNPWGILNPSGKWKNGWFGSAAAPAWGFSRLFMQKPLAASAIATLGWSGVLAYLASDTQANYNLTRPTLATWCGQSLPNFADLAGQIAVVRNNQNPDGAFDQDHASAQHTLYTGKSGGPVGVVTVLQHEMRKKFGVPPTTKLPAVSVREPGWSLGAGEYATDRPMFLRDPFNIPTNNPFSSSTPAWAAKAAQASDMAFLASRQDFMAQSAANFVNDKSNAAAYINLLVDPTLHLTTAPGSSSKGVLMDGKTPVTTDMLTELFGLTSAATAAGDPWQDAFGAAGMSTWTMGQNDFGLNAALAVRLLQFGAPVVSLSIGSWDTHSYEVVDPNTNLASTQGNKPHPLLTTQLTRVLTGLAFALKNIADPDATGKSLWDSTVIFVCSEFGRTIMSSAPSGFNSPNGANDGGSDHGSWIGWPILGGPVVGGGKLFTLPSPAPANTHAAYHQNQIFTTILQGMGIDYQEYADPSKDPYLPFSDYPPITSTGSTANAAYPLIAGV